MIKPWEIIDRKPLAESGELVVTRFRQSKRQGDHQITVTADVPVFIEKGADEDAVIYQQLLQEGLFE